MNAVEFALTKGILPFLKKELEEVWCLQSIKILEMKNSDRFDFITVEYLDPVDLIFLGQSITRCRLAYYSQKEKYSSPDVSQPCD